MVNWLLFNIHIINFWYSLSGLILLAVTAVLVFDYFFNEQKIYLKFVSQYFWWIIILSTIGGATTTLLYSEVFGFVPCSLCWLQRVALYPQVFLGLVAFKLKDSLHFPIYGIVLSAFGLIVAIYQYILQMMPKEVVESGIMPCLTDGTADCSDKLMEVFGFVTFPFLSAILFAFLIIIFLHQLRSDKLR